MINIANLFWNIPFILIAILALGFLIAFHELGHWLFCKLFKVHTPSFSIGFGPRIFEKKIWDTTFAISAIPLGGYVEIAGSQEVGQGEQLQAQSKDENSFALKPYWQKMLIIGGGIIFNLIFAFFALTGLYYFGAPCLGPLAADKKPVIASIVQDAPAQKAGLKAQDEIIAVNNIPVDNVENFIKNITPFTDKKTTLKIKRDNQEQDIEINVESVKQGQKTLPRIGVYWYIAPLGFLDSIKEGVKSTWKMVTEIFGAIKGLAKSTEGVGGPLMIIAQVKECASMGLKVLLFMLAFISVNLAVFNLIPLPIFDGGQALFYTIEAILGRPLSDDIRYKIHYATWILILVLIVYLTYKDIFKLLGF